MTAIEKIIFTLVVGVLSILGALVIGGIILSHKQNVETPAEIITLLKMSVTGIIGIIGGYIGGNNAKKKED